MRLTVEALHAPFLARESRLQAILTGIQDGRLKVVLPSVEPISSIARLANQFCGWARGLSDGAGRAAEEGRPPLSLQAAIGIVKLANKLGQPQLSRIIVERVRLVRHMSPHICELEFQAAKTFRLLGDHSSALAAYQSVVNQAKDERAHFVPKVILNLGKMSHSYDWRTGLYLQLTRIAESRFRCLPASSEVDEIELGRQVAICIDCCCQTQVLIGNGTLTSEIVVRWDEALALAAKSTDTHSHLRIRLRKTFAEFKACIDADTRAELLNRFKEGILLSESLADERRGLATRYGQLAEMKSELGDIGGAVENMRAAIELSIEISDWRTLAKNAVRNSVLCMRAGLSSREADLDVLLMAQSRLLDLGTAIPTDVEVDLLRQLARHHSALGQSMRARQCLDEVVQKLETFENRILAESSLLENESDSTSVYGLLANVLDPDERMKVLGASLVDYTILSRFERSVIRELLDTVNSELKHLGNRQQVSISRLAVSAVLHDQKGRVDRQLSELRDAMKSEFDEEPVVRGRLLTHLEDSVNSIMREFNTGLERFAPRIRALQEQDRVEAVAISDALSQALERGRFKGRYPTVRFELIGNVSRNFGIGIDADLLITVLDNLIENAAKAIIKHRPSNQCVRLGWDWQNNLAQLNPTASIIIEDSAGAVEELELGIAGETNRQNGLKLAEIFFGALFGQIYTGNSVRGVQTKLVVELHASEIVRLL